LLADYVVSTYDQNVQVHLPQSISTDVERQTVHMLTDLLSLDHFDGTITTGATAGNILGIAAAREHVVHELTGDSVSLTGRGNVKVLCAGGHSSISKACSILGIGRHNCINLTSEIHPASFNISQLKHRLEANEKKGIGSIIVATFGEINTGTFTTMLPSIQTLCNRYQAWLHIDAAFGILAHLHPRMQHLTTGLHLADSISFDGHKFFNVPYDCGVFLTRHMNTLSIVCGNTGAAYLSGAEGYSPLNISLENSRRFRALPLYASLLSLGREGYVALVEKCCAFALAIGERIDKSKVFRLLWRVEFNIVLFQAKGHEDVEGNERVKDAINKTGKVYISGTQWQGGGALRIAVCSHLTPSPPENEATQILAILENAIP
jgi:glutamate/tyrosine decarboxylase-like PLP-dependent enzyme